MADTPTLPAPQAGVYPLERREVHRFQFPTLPALWVVARPSLEPFKVNVKDISPKGAGLFSAEPIEPGHILAVRWVCSRHGVRTIRAKVVRLAPLRSGGWILGCVFKERLSAEDVEAFHEYHQDRSDTDFCD